MRTITNNLIFENKLNFSNNNLTRLKSNLTTSILIGIFLIINLHESFGQLQKIVEYQSDGKTIRSKYQIDTQNRKQGICEEYFANGILSTKGNFVNNKLDGLYEDYYPNGKLKIRCTAKSNHLQGSYGPYEEYYESGKLKIKRNYVNPRIYRQELDGETLEYYENGNLKTRKNYKIGLMIGEQEFRHEDGKLEKKYFINSNGIHGPFISYFEDGQIEEKCEYINGKLSGLREVYKSQLHGSSNYHIESRESHLNGFRNGKSETFGDDGKLKESGNYLNDIKNGVWKYFRRYDSRTGKDFDNYLYKQETYKIGRLNGEVMEYYPNGNITMKVNYVEGNKRGILEFYNENGTLSRREFIN
jgi:antitoxin component YwqK of YwqJK toxin-antitoxin module